MTVRAFTDPLLGIAGPPVEFERPERATLADIVALVPLDNEALRPHLRVKLGGVVIDPALYRRVLPKADAYLTVVLPVQGGRGGGFLATIAAVALIGASLFVGGGGLAFLGTAFASGGIGASLVAGGLSLAASLLLQGLNAPAPTSDPEGDSGQVGVASAQNSFEPGAYLPRVLGTRKISPPMVMPPYTEVVDEQTFVTAVYGLAGPHSIASIKIGTAEIADADDVEYEVKQGFASDTPLSLVTRTVIEDGVNLTLSRFITSAHRLNTSITPNTPIWHRVETKDSPDAATLTFSFDQGFAYIGSEVSSRRAATALRFRFRQKGTSTWINLPELPIHGSAPNRAVQLMVNFLWTAPGDMPGTVEDDPDTGGFDFRGKWNIVTPSAGPTWSAASYFSGNVMSWRERNWDVYLNTSTFPKGRYEIEVIRGYTIRGAQFDWDNHWIDGSFPDRDDFFQSATSGSDQVVAEDQSTFADGFRLASVLSIWNEYPFDLTGQPTTLIAIRAKNRSLDGVNCIASGLTDDWNGSSWVASQATSNPASWYRETLRSELNAEPVPDSLIDMANLQDWHEWCEAEGHEVNAIVQGQPVDEVLSLIAQSGFARPRYGVTHGVVIDRPRSPVGLVTQRNAAGFNFEKPFGRLPHALRVNLADAANDYEVRELTVYADGYNADGSGGKLEASRFESVTYHGIVDEAEAEARAVRDMRFARHRSRLINFTMDIEHLEFQIGDLAWLETDILGQIGGRGRVRSIETAGGFVTALGLDEERDFTAADAAGQPRGIAVRLMDGTVTTHRVTSDDSDRARVVLATPFAMPQSGGEDLLVAGSLVATGTLGSEARKILIWDMAPGPELTCRIVGIDYAQEQVYRLFDRAAPIAGVGVLSASAQRIRKRSVAFACVGALTTSFTSGANRDVLFIGAGVLAVVYHADFVRQAAFNGAGAVTVAPRRSRTAAVAFDATGSLTASGTIVKYRSIGFDGAGTFAVANTVTRLGGVSFDGAGSLSVEMIKTINRSVAFAGAGTLSSSRGRDFSADFNNDFR